MHSLQITLSLFIVLACVTSLTHAQNKSASDMQTTANPNCKTGCDGHADIRSTAATHAEGQAQVTRRPGPRTSSSDPTSKNDPDVVPLIAGTAAIRVSEPSETGVQWDRLMLHSNMFLGTMHVFRIVTEPSTRMALHNSVFGGYFKALGAMHGWSDGDGYYENYLGHPIQGAASAYLWLNHDRRYAATEFGSSREYWMSRFRAFGFAWAFSEQFEVGPISEASIGQIQRYCCAYGFVDHVITPTGGMVWVIGEDIIDKYVVREIENRTRNRALRMIARMGLNPPQSFANVMSFRPPWHRQNRPGVLTYDGDLYGAPTQAPLTSPIPKVELTGALPEYFQLGDHPCVGGSAIGALRLKGRWQWTLQAGGCSLRNLPRYWSGDSLTFATGPQWIAHTMSRWSQHAHFRLGGQKVTAEYVDPVLKQSVLGNLPAAVKPSSVHRDYAQDFESTGFSLSVGAGIDLRVHPALAVRLANVDYVRSWLGHLNGIDLNRGLRINAGIVLRVGTW